jgi:hypothetical protein
MMSPMWGAYARTRWRDTETAWEDRRFCKAPMFEAVPPHKISPERLRALLSWPAHELPHARDRAPLLLGSEYASAGSGKRSGSADGSIAGGSGGGGDNGGSGAQRDDVLLYVGDAEADKGHLRFVERCTPAALGGLVVRLIMDHNDTAAAAYRGQVEATIARRGLSKHVLVRPRTRSQAELFGLQRDSNSQSPDPTHPAC